MPSFGPETGLLARCWDPHSAGAVNERGEALEPRSLLSNLLVAVATESQSLPEGLSLRDALVEFLRAGGLPVVWSSSLGDDVFSGRVSTVGVVLDADTIGIFSFDVSDERHWLTPPRGQYGQDEAERLAEHRREVVGRALRNLILPGLSMGEMLSSPFSHTPAGRCTRALVITAWWRTRMSEGHTPETARLLLGLTAHPSVASAAVLP